MVLAGRIEEVIKMQNPKDHNNQEFDIERAWKDEDYRNNLAPEQIANLPPNPAGEWELSVDELDDISGGVSGNFLTALCQAASARC